MHDTTMMILSFQFYYRQFTLCCNSINFNVTYSMERFIIKCHTPSTIYIVYNIRYRQCFDLEGETGVVVRAIGTAVSLARSTHYATSATSLSPSKE